MVGLYLIRFKGEEILIQASSSLGAVTDWIKRVDGSMVKKDEDEKFNPEYFTVKYLGNETLIANHVRY